MAFRRSKRQFSPGPPTLAADGTTPCNRKRSCHLYHVVSKAGRCYEDARKGKTFLLRRGLTTEGLENVHKVRAGWRTSCLLFAGVNMEARMHNLRGGDLSFFFYGWRLSADEGTSCGRGMPNHVFFFFFWMSCEHLCMRILQPRRATM